jgi:hypothetical protein
MSDWITDGIDVMAAAIVSYLQDRAKAQMQKD